MNEPLVENVGDFGLKFNPLTFETIVRSAALAMGCGYGVFLRSCKDKPEVGGCYGGALSTAFWLDGVLMARLAELTCAQILIVEGSDKETSYYLDANNRICVVAAAPIFNAEGRQ